jgi:Kef-type K+ transport system membrane component KefB
VHVVFRESHGLEDTAAPHDMGQDPADLIVLSFSDSDLGAFAAGLLFEPVFLRHFETPRVVQEAAPLLPPGERGRELRAVLDPAVVGVALGVTAAAIAGKLAAGVFAGDAGKWVVGWGMVPRGEVGLIFAAAGRQLGVMDDAMFSMVVIMVILTTLLTPPVLTGLLRRAR